MPIKPCLFQPPVSPDVIDVSSGEDDAIVHINEEEESEPSGAHANDALNQPDARGRVLVNMNHPAAEEDIFLSPQLARAVKPHQVFSPMDSDHCKTFKMPSEAGTVLPCGVCL